MKLFFMCSSWVRLFCLSFVLSTVFSVQAKAEASWSSQIRSLISQSGSSIPDANRQKLLSNVTAYETAIQECAKERDSAQFQCAESNSKGLNGFLDMMGTVSTAGATMAMADACNKMADLMKVGQAAQAGFRTQCSMAKGSCEEACEKAIKLQTSIKGQIEQFGSTSTTSTTVDSPEIIKLNEQIQAAEDEHKVCFNKAQAMSDTAINKNLKGADLASYNKGESENKECAAKARQLITELSIKRNALQAGSSSSAIASIPTPSDETTLDPKKNLDACKGQAAVVQKAGANLSALMTSMQQNRACADEVASLGPIPCEVTNTCAKTDHTKFCEDPANKTNSICADPNILNPNNQSQFNNPDMSGFNLGKNDGRFFNGLDDDLDSSGSKAGGDTTDFASLNDNARQGPGVPNGGGGGLGPSGGGSNGGSSGGGRRGGGGGTTGENQFGAMPGYTGSFAIGSNSNKDDKGGDKDGLGKDANAIILPNGEKINKRGGMTIFEKLRGSLYNQVGLGTLYQPNITLTPLSN